MGKKPKRGGVRECHAARPSDAVMPTKPLPHLVESVASDGHKVMTFVPCERPRDCEICLVNEAAAEHGDDCQCSRCGDARLSKRLHSMPLSDEAEQARKEAQAQAWNGGKPIKPCADYPNCKPPCPICEPTAYAEKMRQELALKDPLAPLVKNGDGTAPVNVCGVCNFYPCYCPKGTDAVKTYSGGATYYGGWDKNKWCTHKGSPVFTTPEGQTLYGAQLSEAKDWPAVDLVIDCADSRAEVIVTPPGYEKLARHYLDFPTIYLPWPDRKAPPIAFMFWIELADMLPARTLACCIGSHGRTGTALSAIYMATEAKAGRLKNCKEAVDFIRAHHCSEAVESQDQIDYLVEFAAWLKQRAKKAEADAAKETLRREAAALGD